MNDRAPLINSIVRRPDSLMLRSALLVAVSWGASGCATQNHSSSKTVERSSLVAALPEAQARLAAGSADPAVQQTIGTRSSQLLPMPELPGGTQASREIPWSLARFAADLPPIVRLLDSLGMGDRAASSSEGASSGPTQDAIQPASFAQPGAVGFPPDVLREVEANPAGETPESIPQASPPQPIDLPAALRLADQQNPTIAEARILILAALASRQAAYSLLLPTFNTGGNYRDHVGVVQRSNGAILPVTEQSLYLGSGARALGTDTNSIPGVNIFSPLTDAIFEPLAAQQRVRGARSNAAASANTVLLDVATLYFRLLGAQAAYEARKVTAKEADTIAASVLVFANTGQGRRSDAERANVDRRLYQVQILRAEELMAVTAAQLAERLNLDPSSRLQPANGLLEPIELIDPATPVETLIQAALVGRPDLEARRAVVAEAEFQVRREKARPLLPTVWVSFSGGAFGGGSNLVPPTFSQLGGRTDFDARVYWTLLNFGAGNASLIKQRRAQAGQAVADQARVINEIRSQVTTARALALSLKNRIMISQTRLSSANDGFSQDQARLRETLAKPIEALDSLSLLSEARIALIEAITQFNQNQFSLFVALGAPPPL